MKSTGDAGVWSVIMATLSSPIKYLLFTGGLNCPEGRGHPKQVDKQGVQGLAQPNGLPLNSLRFLLERAHD